MVADDVVVAAEVFEHLLIGVLPVAGTEAILDLDRVAGPVQAGGPAQQGTAAAVDHAPDDLVLGIVVRCPGVFVHVEPGIAADAGREGRGIRVAETHQVEDGEPLAIVQPVEHHREFLVVHPVPRHRHIHGLRMGVLPEVPFPAFGIQITDRLGGPQRIEDRPVRQVFDRVIGSVVASPPLDAFQPAPFVKVSVEEGLARLRVGLDQLALEQSPGRRWGWVLERDSH